MDALLAQYLVNWLVLASIYALIALGFSLLFGVLNVIHFSHGDVSMTAPFVALAMIQILTGGLLSFDTVSAALVACAVAIAFTGLLGVLLDWLVIRRFRNAPAMMALVATVALGTTVRELIRTFYPQGSNPKPFPELVSGDVTLFGLAVPAFSLTVIAICILMVAALFVLMQHTPIGVRIRAVAEDRNTARLMAINPSRMFATTFLLASAVGGIGGIFYASHAGVVRFDFGIQLGLIGFSAAVIGGLGSMQGAILGSLLIAGVEMLTQALLANGASYRLVCIFVLVICVLVFKPSGLLGKPVFEKV
jgi:branched-chain amino acid transport system permease protein